MGQRESRPGREIHSIIGLLQETRKISNKQYNFTHKGTRNRKTNKDHSEWQKGNNNDWSRIK